jgi:flagellar biosynthetic protein FliQ
MRQRFLAICASTACAPALAFAQALPALTSTPMPLSGGVQWSLSIQTLLLLTGLTFLPALILMMTSFTRIIIVFSLAAARAGNADLAAEPGAGRIWRLFLTFFIMAPGGRADLQRGLSAALAENKIGFPGGAGEGCCAAARLHAEAGPRRRPGHLFQKSPSSPTPARGRRDPDAHPDSGLRHFGTEDGLPDRLHRLHTVSHHRHDRGLRADVDGDDDDVAGHRLRCLSRSCFFVLVDGWNLLIGSLVLSFGHMTPTTVIEIGRGALELTLLISAPLFIAALVTGLIVSIFQAATQINEATLSFVPKLVAIFVTLILAGPWMITMMTDYMQRVSTVRFPESSVRIRSQSCDGGAGIKLGCDARRCDAAMFIPRQESQRRSAPNLARSSGLRPDPRDFGQLGPARCLAGPVYFPPDADSCVVGHRTGIQQCGVASAHPPGRGSGHHLRTGACHACTAADSGGILAGACRHRRADADRHDDGFCPAHYLCRPRCGRRIDRPPDGTFLRHVFRSRQQRRITGDRRLPRAADGADFSRHERAPADAHAAGGKLYRCCP